MTERRENAPLSTADVVAAAGREQPADPAASQRRDEPGFVQREVRAEEQPAARTSSATATAERPSPSGNGASAGGKTAPLVSGEQAQQFRGRWETIQTGFVDEPRNAVEQADQLVAEVIKRVAEVFASERSKLEAQWSSGGTVDTEALRVALTRYRSFFERLLST